MVAVVTDSAANVPADLARDLGIHVVPLYLKFGEQVYRDGVDMTPSDFYERLLRHREPASTAAASPGDWIEAFERAGHDGIVCVTVAASMSSNHQQAALAAERFEGRVELVDSRSASMAEGFVAVEAARLAAAGTSLERVAEEARDLSMRTRLYAMVDTFEFLQKSGRVTKLQAYAATMLDIKPVFSFREGDITPVARSRTRRRALARIVEDSLAEMGGRPTHLAVIHAAAEQDARDLLARIAAQARLVESLVTEVTPVVGAHTGPGLVGTTFWCE